MSKEFSTGGDSTSMRTVITYHFNDATITQTVTLAQSSQMATATYTIQSNGQAVTRLHLPLFFCLEPKSVSTDPQDGQIEVAQEPDTQFSGKVPVTTRLSLDLTDATVETPIMSEGQISLEFDIHSANASITLSFDVSTTKQPGDEPVTAYEVPQLIKDNAVGYLAIDLRPHSALWSDLPLGLEEWLNTCPYYKLRYSEGDIRIYEVDASALP
jgi:hypothetical protein